MRLIKIHSSFYFCFTHFVHSSFSIDQFNTMIGIYFEPENSTLMTTFTIILFLHTFRFFTCQNNKRATHCHWNLLFMTLKLFWDLNCTWNITKSVDCFAYIKVYYGNRQKQENQLFSKICLQVTIPRYYKMVHRRFWLLTSFVKILINHNFKSVSLTSRYELFVKEMISKYDSYLAHF